MNPTKGISLHIGMNSCDPAHYRGWKGPLSSCENDADTMQVLAKSQGFKTRQLKTKEATRDAVRKAFLDAASEMSDGDLFLVSYSGHGGQVRDVNADEDDKVDDTWCLYDGQLLDDELNVLFTQFASGVRLLILSDSCHSGTLLKSISQPWETPAIVDDFVYSRAMPRSTAKATYNANRSFYSRIQDDLPSPHPKIKASVRLLSGCQENEESFGSKKTGRFTHAVKTVFNDGAFKGNYKQFHREIVAAVAKAMHPQTPGHSVIGAPDDSYDSQEPFSI